MCQQFMMYSDHMSRQGARGKPLGPREQRGNIAHFHGAAPHGLGVNPAQAVAANATTAVNPDGATDRLGRQVVADVAADDASEYSLADQESTHSSSG